MTRTPRKPKPALSDSWGIVESDEEENLEDDNIEEEEEEEERLVDSILSASASKGKDQATPIQKRTTRTSGLSKSYAQLGHRTRASPRLSRSQNFVGGASQPLSPVVTRSTRSSSRKSSVEPELIMPSMQEDQMDSSRISGSPQGRRRNVRSSTPSTSALPASPSASKHTSSGRPRKRPGATENEPGLPGVLWSKLFYPAANFVFSVLQAALKLLKPLLVYALAMWLLIGLGMILRNLITSTVSDALTPVCYIPGMSRIIPFCSSVNRPHPAGPPEFDQLMTVQSAFEDVLSSSSSSATLPADMKRSELSIRDLRTVVSFSSLPSRNELVFEFSGFVDTARQASLDLTKFNSRIGRAVDHILSTNRWTLQVIDSISEREAGRGALTRLVVEKLMAPFTVKHTADDLLLEQYLKHTRAVEDEIQDLILEAQELLRILQNLDDRLDVIATIALRDGIAAQGSRDELFAALWTKLGGNRSSVHKLNEQLKLLKQVSQYRKLAWAHVSATILKLQAIAAGLEDLRERVAAPEVVGTGKGVPLEMHIQSIQLGVERLEAQRVEARRLEGENYRRVLDRGERGAGEERMIEGGKVRKVPDIQV